MEDNIDYTAQDYSDIYDLLIEQMENEYTDFATFEDEFNTTFDGNGGDASDWIFAEMIARGSAAQLYLPDAIGTANTLVTDVALGLGGAAASDIARLFSTTNLATVVDDFGSAAVGSGSPLLAQAQTALNSYARFAAKNAIGLAVLGVGSQALLVGVNEDIDAAAKVVATFGVGIVASNLGKSMMSGYAASLADGFIGPVSGEALAFYGSKFAAAGGGLLLAGAAAYAFGQAWDLAKEIHSGEFVSDYGWFLGKVQEYAEGYIDDAFDGEIDPQDIGDALAPFLDLWNDVLPVTEDVAPWVPGVLDLFDDAEDAASPLVLDLDGDGVELTSLASGAVYWDIDLDDMAEASAWVTGGDGLLVVDLNEDGVINNHAELFGDQTGSPNGFAALGAYDSNSSGYITSADADWGDLLVWIDANEDGYSQEAELHTLDELLITSIDLGYSNVSYTISGNEIKQESTFTINGNTRDIVDAWFAYDNVNTRYAGEYELDSRTLFLPTLRGYGKLPDLHIAMSQNEDLLDMVAAVAAAPLADLLDPTFDLAGKVKAIMYEWAGVSDVALGSRGPYLQDARMLEFLEEFVGKDFLQNGLHANPFYAGSLAINETFAAALNEIFVRIVAGTELAQLLEGGAYDVLTDSFGEFTGVNVNVFADIEALADVSSDPGHLWRQVALLVQNPEIFDDLDPVDYETVLEAFIASGAATNGTSGNDTLTGNSDNNTLRGGDGNDNLTGNAGADTLIGGAGHDGLTGGTGNDIYVFAPDFGDLTTSGYTDGVVESPGEGTDTIYFTGGIDPEDLYVWADSSGWFWLERIADADDVIKLTALTDSNGTAIANRIERIVFETGVVWNLSEGINMNDTSTGHTLFGAAGNDIINANGGNDLVYAYGGDDILNGGAGHDTLYGGTGDDMYVYDPGFGDMTTSGYPDAIGENIGEGTDTIYVRGITPNDVYFWTESSGYFYMQFANDADDRLQGTAGVNASGTQLGSRFEYLIFEDGTTYDLTQGLYLNDTSENHTIYGAAGNDTIYGNGGNDNLYGYAGNDTFVGGAGNDSLFGGTGNDTYVFAAGFGSGTEYITENASEGTDTIYISGALTPADVYFWTESSGYFYMQFVANASDLLQGTAMTDANGTMLATRIESVVFESGTTWDLTQGLHLSDNGYGHSVYGAATNDTIYGNDGNDTLYGYAGNDIIDGGSGNDSLLGGDGADTLYTSAGLDTLSGGGGDDLYIYSGGLNNTVSETGGGADTLWITGGTTVNDISFSASGSYNTKITVTASVNEIYVNELRYFSSTYHVETIKFDDGFYADLPSYQSWLNGTSGNDTSTGNGSANTQIGFAGNDTMDGNGGDDAIHGGSGNDSIEGGDGADLLHGGVGDDSLYGENGLDTLFGGAGADTFFFDTNAFNNIDVVKDFITGQTDKLDIADILVGYDPMTDLIADFVTFTNSGANTQMFVDRDGSGAGSYSSVQIALLEGVTNLNAETLETNGNLITV